MSNDYLDYPMSAPYPRFRFFRRMKIQSTFTTKVFLDQPVKRTHALLVVSGRSSASMTITGTGHVASVLVEDSACLTKELVVPQTIRLRRLNSVAGKVGCENSNQLDAEKELTELCTFR